jgi:hypothetical protein
MKHAGSEEKRGDHLCKRLAWPALAVSAAVLLLYVVAWSMSLHGAMGLLHWNLYFKLFTGGLLAYSVLMLALVFVLALRRSRICRERNGRLMRLSSRLAKAFILGGVVLPLSILISFHAWQSKRSGDKAPLLLASDQAGDNGIPDLAVSFWTQGKTVNTLSWGAGDEDRTVKETASANQHSFMLEDLRPATEYWYRINDSETHTFTTVALVPDTLNFAASSDSHFGGNGGRDYVARNIVDTMANGASVPDYFFYLGDFTEYGFQDSSWKEGMEALTPHSRSVPLRPVMGNHDGIFTGINRYLEYLYPRGIANLSGSRLWYRLDVNDVHLIFLNLEWGAESFFPEQRQWLEEQLASIPPEDWTIVMQHAFYYASDHFMNGDPMYVNLDAVDNLVPYFEANDVDLVISGHEHHMELLEQNGVCYAVVGAMGGELDDIGDYNNPLSLWKNDENFGYLDVEVAGDKAVLTFRGIGGEPLYTREIGR